MTITIELSPEIETGLATLAAAQGLSVPEYVRHLLEEQVPAGIGEGLSPAERAKAWRDSAKDLPLRPPYPTKRSAGKASMTGTPEPEALGCEPLKAAVRGR